MTKVLNLPCPYKVTLSTATQTYFFTTKTDIEYQLAFIDFIAYFTGTSTEGLVTKVYSLNIDKLSTKKALFDQDVQLTVACVVSHFFQDKENSLIYVCDHSDSRHSARKRKFDKWFADAEINHDFVKLDDMIITADGAHYTCLIFNAENPFREYVKTGYFEVIEALNKPAELPDRRNQ